MLSYAKNKFILKSYCIAVQCKYHTVRTCHIVRITRIIQFCFFSQICILDYQVISFSGVFFSDDNIYEDYTGAIRRPEKSSKYTSQKKYQQTIKRQIIFITPHLNLSVNMLQPIIVMSLNKYEYILCLRKVGQNVLDQRTETKIMIAI